MSLISILVGNLPDPNPNINTCHFDLHEDDFGSLFGNDFDLGVLGLEAVFKGMNLKESELDRNNGLTWFLVSVFLIPAMDVLEETTFPQKIKFSGEAL